ncbi:MAG TPA: hybrid sensor histidine kinase/response regulator [Burkholderiaceae bacterium]|nr:hybrid sensor histidine kinase/response regulator [Burkholderiaceae bacterium]
MSFGERLAIWVGWRAAPPSEARDDPQELVSIEVLRLLAEQSLRMPYPVGLSAVFMALMAALPTRSPWPVLWMVAVLATLLLRRHVLGRLPQLEHYPVSQRMRWAVMLSLLNGLVFSVALVFSASLSDYERMVQTILLLGLCAGAVASTGGYLPVFLAFSAPVTLANGLAWLTGGAGAHATVWQDAVMGGLILLFGFMLRNLARDNFRVFSDSVLIRQQQVKSNQQLRAALKQTEQAMQAKTRFLASASHDLRQPMHTLTLFGSALLRRRLDEDSLAVVRNMNLAIDALSGQMDALLDISKLDAEVVPVHPKAFNLGHWLGRLQQEFLPSAQRKRLELTLICPHNAYVETDPLLLERVVRNLIDNAIKYTQAGQISIVAERRGELWQVSVRDTGCGIAEQEQQKVFDEFYQIGNKERDRAKGLGLGLSIVSRLVDLLDLHLQLESTPGVGSCFTLGIEAAEEGPDSQLEESSDGRSLRGLKVLVVDDEELVRQAMCTLLEGLGCQARCAGTTREAVLLCMQQAPDLLLIDYRLRGSDDGLSAVRSLRNLVPALPALLISGDTAPQRLRDAQAAGLDLLHKPVRADQLVSAMQRVLAGAAVVPRSAREAEDVRGTPA